MQNRGPACKYCPASKGGWSPEECIGCQGNRTCDDKVDFGEPIFQGESEPPLYRRKPKRK